MPTAAWTERDTQSGHPATGRVPALGPGGDPLPLLPRKFGAVVIPGQVLRDTSAFPALHLGYHGDEGGEHKQREKQAHSKRPISKRGREAASAARSTLSVWLLMWRDPASGGLAGSQWIAV